MYNLEIAIKTTEGWDKPPYGEIKTYNVKVD
jgi:hypothetical protein